MVTGALTKFSKLLGKDGYLETHQKNSYHVEAVKGGNHFLEVYHKPEKDIINKIDSYHLEVCSQGKQKPTGSYYREHYIFGPPKHPFTRTQG